MLLNRVLTKVKVIAVYGSTDIEITTLTNDSRECVVGSIYAHTSQNPEYITDAVKNGAVCIVSEYPTNISGCSVIVDDVRKAYALMAHSFYGAPDERLKLLGVTGTNGKTSVAEHVSAIFGIMNVSCGRIGTLGIRDNGKNVKTGYTTPGAVRFYSALNEMACNGVQYAVTEVSSHALALNRIYGADFKVGVLTNITPEHLDYHKTIEEYARVKASFSKMCEHFIVNTDDKICNEIYRDLRGKRDNIYSLSLKSEADFKGELQAHGILHVKFREKEFNVRPSSGAEFSGYNALCALAAVIISGITPPSFLELPQVQGRMELVSKGTPYNVYIDYAHTEDSMSNVLRDVRKITGGRLITVFSCGGERDTSKRRPMGRICGKYSDISIITTDNPRGENELNIAAEIISGIEERCDKYKVIIDRGRAIEYAVNIAKDGDAVLILGKGHEEYQIINSLRFPFSDRNTVLKSIEKRNQRA
ncbi:MAG: UDP-N-acetylmuramoyl-L-alanyl-D-glutamate--2,6-diaminopimelate ligase [Clostridiales bacterium]|nr:UDP-N-acetylmuramoyl-L-alanyl-D-glutamate--2,6-diaminopimelate ligase [Clostridiales bacterium]